MKVIVPENTELRGFERELQTVLEQANLAGYALMGFAFREVSSSKLHEIDALVVMEPGLFVCLEAKGYSGTWRGSANERWFCSEQEIKAVSTNPYKQVQRYSYVIKDKLQDQVFQEIHFWVNYFVVAPDGTEFEIEGAVINRFQGGNAIHVFHLSRVEQVLGSVRTNKQAAAKFREFGIEGIIGELTGMRWDQIQNLIVNNRSSETETSNFQTNNLLEPEPREDSEEPDIEASSSLTLNISHTVSPEIEEKLSQDEIKQNDFQASTEPSPKVLDKSSDDTSISSVQEREEPNFDSKHHRKIKSIILAFTFLGVGILGSSVALAHYYWENRPCEASSEIRKQGICYKDISRSPLLIGILTQPEKYTQLQTYLKKQLGSQVLDVVIEGNSEITYQEAQDNIAKRKWDVVFALSPMNSMRAKDNGYKWIARMFPSFPPTYQSALFVKKDSPIMSLNDITASTILALGDFSSASSFYMPAYDLYGKSITVTPGHKSRKIIELVAKGEADVGANVYTNVKDDSGLRVIHVSREIPGVGVYLSPKLSPTTQQQIKQMLMDVPQTIKEEANYGTGEEPDYEAFRAISLKADEILSCADFSKKAPVDFFCSQKPQGIVGTINGFTNEGDGMIRLRLKQKTDKTCYVMISLQTLSRVPGGTSPGIINRKQVSIIGVEPKQLGDGICTLTIDNSNQLVVLKSGI